MLSKILLISIGVCIGKVSKLLDTKIELLKRRIKLA